MLRAPAEANPSGREESKAMEEIKPMEAEENIDENVPEATIPWQTAEQASINWAE